VGDGDEKYRMVLLLSLSDALVSSSGSTPSHIIYVSMLDRGHECSM
jgi:hypothetical protein